MATCCFNPPGSIPTWPYELPHWPYVTAVDDALTALDIPPGSVRADRTGREHGERMYIVLAWDVSRTAGPGGLRLHWGEESGWAAALTGGSRTPNPIRPLMPLRRVFATPHDVAEVTVAMVRNWRRPVGEFAAEWERTGEVRTEIDAFRRHMVDWIGRADRFGHGCGVRHRRLAEPAIPSATRCPVRRPVLLAELHSRTPAGCALWGPRFGAGFPTVPVRIV